MDGLESGDVLPSGRFRLVRPVENAKGAFGQVYYSETVGGDGEPVRLAIKKITMGGAIQSMLSIYPNLPNPRHQLAREWRTSLLAVDHPNLCRSYAVEFTDRAGRQADLATCTHAYLVMEWAGDTLIDVVVQRGGLDEAEAREYMWQIIIGIQALHADGYSHRDIKPENITVR
jgi:serine/threonine protein kinase